MKAIGLLIVLAIITAALAGYWPVSVGLLVYIAIEFRLHYKTVQKEFEELKK